MLCMNLVVFGARFGHDCEETSLFLVDQGHVLLGA
jgi:hypothetical protein